MKLDPGFASHWKTERLIDRCGPAAVVGLLRLWGDCQIRRRFTGLALTPAKLAAMMRYEGDHTALWEAMTDADAPWLDAEEGGTWAVHDFGEHNKQVIHLWEAGKKGGRRKGSPTPPPNTDNTNTERETLTPFANHMVSNANHLVSRFSVEQVIEAGRRQSIAEDICRAYYDDRAAAGWFDKARRPVHSMPHDLSSFARHWRSNENPKKFGTNGHNGNPKPAEGVWHLEKRIEAAQREIERIQSNPSNKEQIPDSFDRRLKPEHLAKVKALKASISEMRQRMAGVEVAA